MEEDSQIDGKVMNVPVKLGRDTVNIVSSCKKEIVGNKVEGRISKRVFQENKARQIFWKTNIFYPLYAHLRVCIRG